MKSFIEFLGFNVSKNKDNLLEVMLKNHDRVTISNNGVVRLNLNNVEVQKEIKKHIDSLSLLDELEDQDSYVRPLTYQEKQGLLKDMQDSSKLAKDFFKSKK